MVGGHVGDGRHPMWMGDGRLRKGSVWHLLLWRRICMNEGAMILRWRSGRAGRFDENQAGVGIRYA